MKYTGIGRHAPLFGEYTELRVQENRSLRISLLNGDVVGNARGAQGGASARAYKDGVWGFASSPELDDKAIAACVLRATGQCPLPGVKRGLEKAPPAIPAGQDQPGLHHHKAPAQPERTHRLRAQPGRLVCQALPTLSSRSVSLSTLDMEKTLLSSDGAEAYSMTPRTILAVSLTTEAKGEPIDLYDVLGGRGQFEDVFADPATCIPGLNCWASGSCRRPPGCTPNPAPMKWCWTPTLPASWPTKP
jgi:TldD protein